jgi:hypothetical protein
MFEIKGQIERIAHHNDENSFTNPKTRLKGTADDNQKRLGKEQH